MQSFDQRDHIVDVVGGADELLGQLDVSASMSSRNAWMYFRCTRGCSRLRPRRLDDAVVDVGNVHHLHHAVALGMQEAAQNILKHERAKIADMREGVDRRAARVDAHFARMNGLQRLDTEVR